MTDERPRRPLLPPLAAAAPVKKRAKPWHAKSYRRTVLDREGWILFEDVERHLAFGHVTYDYLGFGDLQLFHPDRGWVLESICVKQGLAEHVASALANKKLGPKWLAHRWPLPSGSESPWIQFAAQVVAYPSRPARLKGDFTPRIVPIILVSGQLRAVDYP